MWSSAMSSCALSMQIDEKRAPHRSKLPGITVFCFMGDMLRTSTATMTSFLAHRRVGMFWITNKVD